jgi:hypothetical protein
VLPLDLLRVALARLVRICLEMTRVGSPIVRIIPRDAKRFQEGFALQKHLIVAPPKDLRQDVPTAVGNRVPAPSGLAFLPHKRPHLIHFGLFPSTDDNGHLIWVEQGQEVVMHIAQR